LIALLGLQLGQRIRRVAGDVFDLDTVTCSKAGITASRIVFSKEPP